MKGGVIIPETDRLRTQRGMSNIDSIVVLVFIAIIILVSIPAYVEYRKIEQIESIEKAAAYLKEHAPVSAIKGQQLQTVDTTTAFAKADDGIREVVADNNMLLQATGNHWRLCIPPINEATTAICDGSDGWEQPLQAGLIHAGEITLLPASSPWLMWVLLSPLLFFLLVLSLYRDMYAAVLGAIYLTLFTYVPLGINWLFSSNEPIVLHADGRIVDGDETSHLVTLTHDPEENRVSIYYRDDGQKIRVRYARTAP